MSENGDEITGRIIGERLRAIQKRVDKALEKRKGSKGPVSIMACTKTHPETIVREVVQEGISLIGENRVQETRDKYQKGAYDGATLCLIGHLQSNKASWAVRMFDEIHSVDSIKLARQISKFSGLYKAKELPCMIEVNIGNDPKKEGCLPEDAYVLAQEILSLEGLTLKGLMTVAPGYGDPVPARKAFSGLRSLRDELISKGIPAANLKDLSMGMSSDYEIAVEEGSTIIRLGTVLLGPRKKRKDI